MECCVTVVKFDYEYLLRIKANVDVRWSIMRVAYTKTILSRFRRAAMFKNGENYWPQRRESYRRPYFGRPYFNTFGAGRITCSTVVLQCYRRQAIPMEQAKIRPSVTSYSLDRSLPNLVWLITSATPTHMQILVKFGLAGNSPQIGANRCDFS